MSGKAVFTDKDRKRTLLTLIFAHSQIVIGAILYIISPLVEAARSNMGSAMKDGVLRFWVVEHFAMMVIAVIFITIGHVKAKKLMVDAAKFKAIAIWFTIGLILILASIPWPFRLVGEGRSWF